MSSRPPPPQPPRPPASSPYAFPEAPRDYSDELAAQFNKLQVASPPRHDPNRGFVGGFTAGIPPDAPIPYVPKSSRQDIPITLRPGPPPVRHSSGDYYGAANLPPITLAPPPPRPLYMQMPMPSSGSYSPVSPNKYYDPYPMTHSHSAPPPLRKPTINESYSDTDVTNPSRKTPQKAGNLSPATPHRPRASSVPPSPTVTSNGGDGDAIQCSGTTKAGKRCTRKVKAPAAWHMLSDSDAPIERYCHQHINELLQSTGYYSRVGSKEWIKFEDWIPEYLTRDTKAALRVAMEERPSPADVPGYIYTYEIRNPKTPTEVHLKVGRAVNLVKRIDEWSKQCVSKEVVLRGWWPGGVDEDASRLKGKVRAGEKGKYCHRLERLVHLELADLSFHEPYLVSTFPLVPADPAPSTPVGKGKSSASSSSLALKEQRRQKCPDCGQRHQEIFTFTKVPKGKLKGREWEGLVQPVIEKWGGFVEASV